VVAVTNVCLARLRRNARRCGFFFFWLLNCRARILSCISFLSFLDVTRNHARNQNTHLQDLSLLLLCHALARLAARLPDELHGTNRRAERPELRYNLRHAVAILNVCGVRETEKRERERDR